MNSWEEVLSKSLHIARIQNLHSSFLLQYCTHPSERYLQSFNLLFHLGSFSTICIPKSLLIWPYPLWAFWSEETYLWLWPIFQTWVNLLPYRPARNDFSFPVLQSSPLGCQLQSHNLKCPLNLVELQYLQLKFPGLLFFHCSTQLRLIWYQNTSLPLVHFFKENAEFHF